MIKRLFSFAVGVGFGFGLAVLSFRWVQRTVERLTPPQVARSVTESARGLVLDVRDAVVEGRAAMRAREAQLRAQHGLPTPDSAESTTREPRSRALA